MNLTPKQHALMLFIQRYSDQRGYAPSYDEMTESQGLVSKSGVLRLLTGLEERGFIERMAHRQRAIRIVRRIPDAAAPPMGDDERDALRGFVREFARSHSADIDSVVKAVRLVKRFGL